MTLSLAPPWLACLNHWGCFIHCQSVSQSAEGGRMAVRYQTSVTLTLVWRQPRSPSTRTATTETGGEPVELSSSEPFASPRLRGGHGGRSSWRSVHLGAHTDPSLVA